MPNPSRLLLAVYATCLGMTGSLVGSAVAADIASIASRSQPHQQAGVTVSVTPVQRTKPQGSEPHPVSQASADKSEPSSTASADAASRTAVASAPRVPEWAWWLGLVLLPIGVVGGILYGVRRSPRKPPRHHYASPAPMEQAVSSPKTVRQQEAIAPVDDSSASRQSHTSQPTQTESSDGSTVDAAAPHLPETLTHPASFSATTRLARVDIVEELIRDLHSSEPDKRRKAIWELGQRGDSRAVQPLVDLLTDSDSNQRSLILAAVSEIGMRSLKPINRALLLSIQDDSADVRKNAIRDVTRIYDLVAQISQLLQHAAGDSDRDVQETAQWALTQLNRIRPASDPDSVSGLPGRMNSAAIESLSEDTQS